jgi:predicted RNase H-like HicB family nuclease
VNKIFSGLVQYTGQSEEEIRKELEEAIKTGGDDVKAFVDMVMGK